MTTTTLPLTAAALAAMRSELRSAIECAGSLDQADLVDVIGELETLGRTVSAAQAALTAELDRRMVAEQAAAALPSTSRGRAWAT